MGLTHIQIRLCRRKETGVDLGGLSIIKNGGGGGGGGGFGGGGLYGAHTFTVQYRAKGQG